MCVHKSGKKHNEFFLADKKSICEKSYFSWHARKTVECIEKQVVSHAMCSILFSVLYNFYYIVFTLMFAVRYDMHVRCTIQYNVQTTYGQQFQSTLFPIVHEATGILRFIRNTYSLYFFFLEFFVVYVRLHTEKCISDGFFFGSHFKQHYIQFPLFTFISTSSSKQ